MRSESFVHRPRRAAALLLAAGVLAAPAAHAQGTSTDPRVGLRTGWTDAGTAARNLELIAHVDRPAGFSNPQNMGDFNFAISDMAFSGNHVFIGGYHGFQVWDVSDPRAPKLRKTMACPGGQGDVSVFRHLLFVSVEEPRGREDCSLVGPGQTGGTSFRGIRIFDISNIDQPRPVAHVQTCRGSHTHTLLADPKDQANVYVYVSGTSPVRPAGELEGCSGRSPQEDPNTSYFRIEVIRVPLANPQQAAVVSGPRIFANRETGNVAGLWAGGQHGPGTQQTAMTNQCHDITVYPELGLAGGACAGNGILLDIRDPVNPVRIHEVSDPNFAYWHSATFNNDGSKVLFSDEWGGGTQARCRATDPMKWGANAIFTLGADRRMQLAGYYKLPAPQAAEENCVAHNGSLIPVPGRDIMVQAWYQGGVSVFDFTNPGRPVELAFFDRGPMAERLVLGGFWSAYWYNGHIYGSEIGRGLDVFRLTPSEHLSQNEIDAANLVRMQEFNPQMQTRLTWPAHFVVARAYVDQLARGNALQSAQIARIRRDLDRAERSRGAARRTALTTLAASLDRDAARSADPAKMRTLSATVRELAGR
ncbi:MAG TPA: hypothetical protein VFS20_00480 [Longimicrobium sp.]|nr:hypothetical protein [Longimicrobium sp.]